MLVGPQFALGGQLLQRGLLPDGRVSVDVAVDLWRKNKKAAVDEATLAFRLFRKSDDAVSIEFENAETAGRIDRGNSRKTTMFTMETDRLRDVHIGNAIPVRKAEGVVLDAIDHALQTAACHGALACVDERHPPIVGIVTMRDHRPLGQGKSHIGHMQRVVREELLDHMPLVAKADCEVLYAVRRVHLHDVPEDRPTADLNQRLRTNLRRLAQPRAGTTSQNHCMHDVTPQSFAYG